MSSIGFILLSSARFPIPSTRIAALNTFPFLCEAGFEPRVVFEPTAATETPQLSVTGRRLAEAGIRAVVFQKVHGPAVEALAAECRALGIRTVYLVCDLVEPRMAALTDATVVVTEFLRSLYPKELQAKIHVVHDGIERPDITVAAYRDHPGSPNRPLRAVLVTSAELDHLPVLRAPPPWLEVEIVGSYPRATARWQRWRQDRWALTRQAGLQQRLNFLRFAANRRILRTAWDPVAVYECLRQADIGIIPVDTTTQVHAALDGKVPSWQVKSENRLTMKMCVGLPVIATPIPAYESVIEQGRNGFLAKSRQEWINMLEALRDPATRRDVGIRARASVIERFSMKEQGRRLAEVLTWLLAA